MIKIGKTIINPAEISAIYPSEGTDGKVWISLRSGRVIYAMATMTEAAVALGLAGVAGSITLPQVFVERAKLEQLLDAGYSFLARDKNGGLWAYTGEPSKSESCWDAEAVEAITVRNDLFDGVIEWYDEEATDIAMLLEDMSISPERYEG